jgi:hypothetical protein
MARILRRPMFRKGGSTNEGIMHGLVNRRGYENGAFGKTARRTQADVYSLIKEMVPPPEAKFPMGQMGLNLISGQYAGDGLLQNVAGSAMDPYRTWTERDDARRDYDRKIKMAAAETGIKQAMTEAGSKDKIGRIATTARDMVNAGYMNPKTNKPYTYQEAFAKAYRDAETSPGETKPDRWHKTYNKQDVGPGGVTSGVAENRADWVTYIRPNIPINTYGGEVPTNYDRKTRDEVVAPEKMTPGLVYWDEVAGKLWEVIEDETGERIPQEVPGWRDKYYKT